MKSNLIVLDKLLKNSSKVLSGRNDGYEARKRLEIDRLDGDNTSVTVSISTQVYSINPSFFLGLFGNSIKELGEIRFREKYKFTCSDAITIKIEQGIQRAVNAFF